ncbi:hypothetical protein GCM10010201_15280 [Pilimelia columellifera subsp. columellifera]|uniref:Glycosyltransferase n=1 Tax=Pilimelia columellifera subsp. columellifera TaxID=706583 RepID=A0ABP6AMZ6_9ACTN
MARRARELSDRAFAELARGRIPADLTTVAASQLDLADHWHAAGATRQAAEAVNDAARLLFHRAIHFDSLHSPLASDPATFLARWRQSATVNQLTAARGRAVPATDPPADRPLRLLVLTNGNPHFLREIRERYAEHPGVELRYAHLAEDPAAAGLLVGAVTVMEHRLGGADEYGDAVRQWLQPHLDWADTVFVDWCVLAAATLTLIDPGATRVVARLHSFEIFTVWPQLMDLSRVDELVFVSEHLRDLAISVDPRLTAGSAPRLHVAPNAMSLTGFAGDKPADARFTVGVIGVSSVAKDPRWAVAVLAELRRIDPRYRLALVGGEISTKAGPVARRYREGLDADIDALGADAVDRREHTADVPGTLRGIGVILSSSVRESFHCALVEGAASGAVPVVRDWPFFAGRSTGARSLFPADWVVDDPRGAADRIAALTADERVWRAAGAAAQALAVATWNWPVVAPEFDRLLLPATDV